MTDYNDGKWHGWNGGSECPVDLDSIVEGMYLRNGRPAPESPVTDIAVEFDWTLEAANTLIAFRVVKPAPPKPPECWRAEHVGRGGVLLSSIVFNTREDCEAEWKDYPVFIRAVRYVEAPDADA